MGAGTEHRGIHQALDLIFQSLSRPHHSIIPNVGDYSGVVIGGPHCTEVEKIVYGMVIALGQQRVQELTGANPTDPILDPVGLYDDVSDRKMLPGSSPYKVVRQISGGHVAPIRP